MFLFVSNEANIIITIEIINNKSGNKDENICNSIFNTIMYKWLFTYIQSVFFMFMLFEIQNVRWVIVNE